MYLANSSSRQLTETKYRHDIQSRYSTPHTTITFCPKNDETSAPSFQKRRSRRAGTIFHRPQVFSLVPSTYTKLRKSSLLLPPYFAKEARIASINSSRPALSFFPYGAEPSSVVAPVVAALVTDPRTSLYRWREPECWLQRPCELGSGHHSLVLFQKQTNALLQKKNT